MKIDDLKEANRLSAALRSLENQLQVIQSDPEDWMTVKYATVELHTVDMDPVILMDIRNAFTSELTKKIDQIKKDLQTLGIQI